nr:MAG TPA: Disulfide bond formation protein B bond, membrane protein, Fab [Caudoviricetes sp.]
MHPPRRSRAERCKLCIRQRIVSELPPQNHFCLPAGMVRGR